MDVSQKNMLRLFLITLLLLSCFLGCSKPPPSVKIHSNFGFGDNFPVGNIATFLEDLSFIPSDQPLSYKELFELSGIILQSHYLAAAHGDKHLEVKKSWRLFKVIDLTLHRNKTWQEFLSKNEPSDAVEAEPLAKIIFQIVG